MNSVDAHLHCSMCGQLTGDDPLLRLEHGSIEYIEHLDLLAFNPKSVYHICESCTTTAYIFLIDPWEEAGELEVEYDLDMSDLVDDGDISWIEAYFTSSYDVPGTWYTTEEPDRCPRCCGTLDSGDDAVQVSNVRREGRRYTEPLAQKSTSRFTWFCESCVREFYNATR